MRLRSVFTTALFASLLSSCVSVPDGLSVVGEFEPDRYLGNWYEIARMDHSFERGLSQVTAEYSEREDGGIKVLNRGYKAEKGEWKEAEGKAYLVQGPEVGQLKVSFFGPFYAAYNIIVLEENYRYAMVAGPDRSYLWILAREPTLPADTLKSLVDEAAAKGFATEELIYVEQVTTKE